MIINYKKYNCVWGSKTQEKVVTATNTHLSYAGCDITVDGRV